MLFVEGLKKDVFVSLSIDTFKGFNTQLLDIFIMLGLLERLSFSDLEISWSFSLVMGRQTNYFLTYSLYTGFYSISKS
jgi:hypothetical protein